MVPTKATSSRGQKLEKPASSKPVKNTSQAIKSKKMPPWVAVPPLTHGQHHQCRTQQGRRADQSNLSFAQAQREQVSRRRDGDKAVSEGAERATDEQKPCFRCDTVREQHYIKPNRRRPFLIGVSAHQA